MLIVGLARNNRGPGIKVGTYYHYEHFEPPAKLNDGIIETAERFLGFRPETILMFDAAGNPPEAGLLDMWTKEQQ